MFKIIFDEKITKITLLTLVWIISYTISEMIFSIIFIMLLGIGLDIFKDTILGIAFTNVMIAGINFGIFSIKYIKNLVNGIMKWYEKGNVFNNIILVFMALMTVFFFAYQNYNENISKSDFVMTIIFFVGIVLIMFSLFKEKTDNIKMSSEYDNMLKYVKTYEDVIEEKSKEQHEYKNQLILIREMIQDKDPNVVEEINKRLKIKDTGKDQKWLEELKNIPNGGLKGLLYYKIKEMIDNDINIYVNIGDEVDNKKVTKKLTDNLEDISKIICVYLDNAREAAKDTEKKYVVFEMKYEKKILTASISNTYKGELEIESIDNAGFSTKNRGTGYGLSLVKDILKKHPEMESVKEMNGMYFVQTVKIKIK